MPSRILWKEQKTGKKTPDKKKSKKSKEVNALITYVKKRVAFEKNKEAEAEAACKEALNNFENLSLDNWTKDGEIDNEKWKSGPEVSVAKAHIKQKHPFF